MATESTAPTTPATTEAAAPKNVSDDQPTMHVKVYAPFKVYFDDKAYNISATNATGPFDILPRHHNFMTLLSSGSVIVRHPRGEEKIAIQRGIMHVRADKVIVFLDV